VLRASEFVEIHPQELIIYSTSRLASLDKAMQEEIDQKRKAGIVVLIARRGSIPCFKAYGMADIESGIKMQTDHLFRLYSTTKPITSVAPLTLCEEGKTIYVFRKFIIPMGEKVDSRLIVVETDATEVKNSKIWIFRIAKMHYELRVMGMIQKEVLGCSMS
jgi:hypothetical protein